jgi:hypothetical protein
VGIPQVLRHPAPIPTGATGSVGTATGFSLGIPYTVSAHNAVNNTGIWCAPLPGGACTTSANSTNGNIYATMPTACTVNMMVYSNVAATLNNTFSCTVNFTTAFSCQ